MAGARDLVMALWSVSDESTRLLMERLYAHFMSSGSAQLALLETQREWIAEHRASGDYAHPFYWAAFVASGMGLSLELEADARYPEISSPMDEAVVNTPPNQIAGSEQLGLSTMPFVSSSKAKAKLKVAEMFLRVGNQSKAKANLKYIIETYPQSVEAQNANEMLRRLPNGNTNAEERIPGQDISESMPD